MNVTIRCDGATLQETLGHLKVGGERNCETVVLWLGELDRVTAVYRPDQEVDADYFRLSPSAMRELVRHLRATRTKILAQAHSHPAKAFHSVADDKWAVVRHAGAVSIVVPYFAFGIEAANFADAVATYQLDRNDQWQPVHFQSVVSVD
jgi:hypothetical protein